MGLGGFLGGAFGAVTNTLGLTSARDNGQGERNVNDFKTDLNQGQNAYEARLGQLGASSDQINNTNYYGGAQDSFRNQQSVFGQQQQAYQNQQQASQMLYNQATGQTPSVADLQMQQGLGNANNQVQSAMLSQQGGMNPGLSQRNMLNAQAMQNAQIVGQGQIARAGEVAQAQQMYNSTLGNISGQANAMQQSAYGMTNQQQNLGQLMYGQNRDNLNYQTGNANNIQQTNAANAQNILAGQQGDIAAAAAAKKDQAAAMGQTLKSMSGAGMIPGVK